MTEVFVTPVIPTQFKDKETVFWSHMIERFFTGLQFSNTDGVATVELQYTDKYWNYIVKACKTWKKNMQNSPDPLTLAVSLVTDGTDITFVQGQISLDKANMTLRITGKVLDARYLGLSDDEYQKLVGKARLTATARKSLDQLVGDGYYLKTNTEALSAAADEIRRVLQ